MGGLRPEPHLLELMRLAQTGTLHCFSNREIETVEPTLSTHALGLGYAMTMGAALNVLPKTVLLYGIEMNPIQYPLKLSPAIMKAVKALSSQLKRNILALLLS